MAIKNQTSASTSSSSSLRLMATRICIVLAAWSFFRPAKNTTIITTEMNVKERAGTASSPNGKEIPERRLTAYPAMKTAASMSSSHKNHFLKSFKIRGLFFYEIPERSVNCCKYAQKRQNDCKNRRFKLKHLIQLYSAPCGDQDDGQHLKGHPGVLCKVIQPVTYRFFPRLFLILFLWRSLLVHYFRFHSFCSFR